MKKFQLLIIAAFFSFCLFGQNNIDQKFYVGTFTSEGGDGIYLCNLNTETGEIGLTQTFKGVDNPSFLKISSNKEFLYTVSRTEQAIEKSGGFVLSYKIEKDGSLKFLNKQISNGAGPCHIDVSPEGDFVAIATYGGGTTSLYQTKLNGSLKPASSVIINSGTGANKKNKVIPHAHSIKFSPFDNTVFSADLGTDQLNIYLLKNGMLESSNQSFVKLPIGAGPRHFQIHANGKTIYVINELNSTISTLHKRNDSWNVVQNISTLPADFKGDSFCADIHISEDGKYLYGSNRGHNSIAIFAIDPVSTELTFIGTVSVEGDWPRNFGISPDGNWMLVANQKSGNIAVFKINKKTGMISFNGNEIKIPAAVCIEFL